MDTTFSGDGIVTLFDSGGALDDTAFAMAIEEDGTIVVGGQENGDLALGFFNSDGSVDTAHDADGIVTQDLGGTERINALIAQSDGTIVVGGVKGNDFAIAKFKSDWTLETTFGASGGYTDTNMGGGTGEGAYGLARQNDGKFLAAGRAGSSFGVARYTSGGLLDTTFNSTGKVTTSLSTSVDYAYAVTVGPDYRITTAGVSANSGSNQNFAMARYNVASGLEQRIYAQTDGNHNITSLASVFGSVLQRYVYDPNGSATVLNSSFGVTSDAYSWVTLFQGKRFDPTTGLYNFNFREYSPTLATFMSVDPMG